MVMDPVTALQLAEWRRATAALYARVREQADPVAAHALWRAGRDGLMSSHPQSALPEGDPLRVTGVPYWPYDLALAFRGACRAGGGAQAARDRHRGGRRYPS